MQSVHALPGPPHVWSLSVWHCPDAEQQPAHDVELQVHTLLTQAWPAGHFALVPHLHWPLVEQLSALDGSHDVHDPPAAPQLPKYGLATQPADVQHPAQDVESQTQEAEEQCSPVAQLAVDPQVHAPVEHVRPVWVQSAHAAPPVPQLLSAEVWHTPADVQQPLGQELALHTQTPPWQT